MKPQEIGLVILFSFGMGLGQILFKFVAQRQLNSGFEPTLWGRLYFLLTDWMFLAGVALYGILLVYWVWLQTFLPLARSYPFTLLSIVIAAAGGYFLFKETITLNFAIGMALVAAGLLVSSWG
jgi:drug/metabolite transporter (DMT)-like permease